MKKKKIFLRVIAFFLIIILSFNVVRLVNDYIHSGIKTDLEGTIYYTERVDNVLTLFKSDANLKNKTLLYSHKGKGKLTSGGYNDHISDFYYDIKTETIYFLAMNNGTSTLFSLKEGEKEPTIVQASNFIPKADYVKDQHFTNFNVFPKEGSLYIWENGDERMLKKFYGMYNEYSNIGYYPTISSPDGNYLVYKSNGLTPFSTILENFLLFPFGNTYIMDLSTMKSTLFVVAEKIQWIN